jgi:hypothetical protein
MRQWIRSHLTYANVMATIAVFIALGGGTTAVALNGSNTVQSDDLGPGAQVKAADVADNAVTGADVKDRSLRNTDLGVRVRSDRQVDDGSGAAECGKDAVFDECITVNFTNPRPQRLMLVGSGEWFGSVSGGNIGECRFSVGNLAQLGLRRFGESSNNAVPSNFAMNSVTGVLDAGFYEIGIDCRDASVGQGNIVVKRTELSVVALGDG